jgi:hypothetical protein
MFILGQGWCKQGMKRVGQLAKREVLPNPTSSQFCPNSLSDNKDSFKVKALACPLTKQPKLPDYSIS